MSKLKNSALEVDIQQFIEVLNEEELLSKADSEEIKKIKKQQYCRFYKFFEEHASIKNCEEYSEIKNELESLDSIRSFHEITKFFAKSTQTDSSKANKLIAKAKIAVQELINKNNIDDKNAVIISGILRVLESEDNKYFLVDINSAEYSELKENTEKLCEKLHSERDFFEKDIYLWMFILALLLVSALLFYIGGAQVLIAAGSLMISSLVLSYAIFLYLEFSTISLMSDLKNFLHLRCEIENDFRVNMKNLTLDNPDNLKPFIKPISVQSDNEDLIALVETINKQLQINYGIDSPEKVKRALELILEIVEEKDSTNVDALHNKLISLFTIKSFFCKDSILIHDEHLNLIEELCKLSKESISISTQLPYGPYS